MSLPTAKGSSTGPGWFSLHPITVRAQSAPEGSPCPSYPTLFPGLRLPSSRPGTPTKEQRTQRKIILNALLTRACAKPKTKPRLWILPETAGYGREGGEHSRAWSGVGGHEDSRCLRMGVPRWLRDLERGSRLKTAGDLGKRTGWRATSWLEVGRGPVVMELTHGELPASSSDWHSAPTRASPVTGPRGAGPLAH